jgi:hypothetical protein
LPQHDNDQHHHYYDDDDDDDDDDAGDHEHNSTPARARVQGQASVQLQRAGVGG